MVIVSVLATRRWLVCRRQGRTPSASRSAGDQAMAVTTVTTAMQVVNAKATAKIAAIFFMIVPHFPQLIGRLA